MGLPSYMRSVVDRNVVYGAYLYVYMNVYVCVINRTNGSD